MFCIYKNTHLAFVHYEIPKQYISYYNYNPVSSSHDIYFSPVSILYSNEPSAIRMVSDFRLNPEQSDNITHIAWTNSEVNLPRGLNVTIMVLEPKMFHHTPSSYGYVRT